jgi:hypothetical protein
MKFSRLTVPALALLVGATGLVATRVYAEPAVPIHPAVSQDRDDRGGWDAPPGELNEIQRRGFHDGIEGARRDYDNHRRPDVNNRDEYRHPHLRYEERQAYRDGFRRGYRMGVRHLWGDRYRDDDYHHDRDDRDRH